MAKGMFPRASQNNNEDCYLEASKRYLLVFYMQILARN